MSYHRPPQTCHKLSSSGYSNPRLKDLNQLPLQCSVELSRLLSGDSGMSHKRATILSSAQWDHRNTKVIWLRLKLLRYLFSFLLLHVFLKQELTV